MAKFTTITSFNPFLAAISFRIEWSYAFLFAPPNFFAADDADKDKPPDANWSGTPSSLVQLSYIGGQLVFHVPIDSQLRVKSTRQCPNYAQNIKSPDLEWILTIIGLSKIIFSRTMSIPRPFHGKNQPTRSCLLVLFFVISTIYSRVILFLRFYVCIIFSAST